LIIAAFFLYDSNLKFGAIISALLGILITVLPEILNRVRNNNTEYAFSANRLYFKIWKQFNVKYHTINLEDISKISYEDYERRNGILHFMLKIKPNFKTHDLLTGEQRLYPTFESIGDVITLKEWINKLRIEKIKNPS